jgi:hypothetical protein
MTIAKLVARIAFAIGEATFVFNQFVKKCVEVFFISPSIDDTGRRPNLQLWRSTMAKQLFYDPFDGWGDLAAKFCITFGFLVPNLLFMHVILN